MTLRLPGVHSLKEKRHLIRGLIEKARKDFGVSITETEDHDLWGNATIGAALVSTNAVQADAVLNKVFELFDDHPELQVSGYLIDIRR